MRPSLHPIALPLVALALATGCADPSGDEPPPIDHRVYGLDAICEVQVNGVGRRVVEGDYLAHVVACENGAAGFEALKAQAVAARSYMYYKVETAGSIGDGQSDQVYSCRAEPRQEHYDAVAQTAGEVLMYRGVVVAAFYVAGASPSAPDCVARAGDNDPTSTERFVTYNEGRSGNNLIQTPLGFVDPGNLRNRGCKSQNGANCLSRVGRDYRDILHFYYGEDIQITRAEGACVMPPVPDMGPPEPDMAPPAPDMAVEDQGELPDAAVEPVDMGPPPDAEVEPDQRPPERDAGGEGEPICPIAGPAPAIVDEASACFDFGCQGGDWGISVAGGFNGRLTLAPTIDAPANDCEGRWRFGVASPGEYTLAAYLPPTGRRLSTGARYRVMHAGGESEVVIDQGAPGWITLGTYTFDPAVPAYVALGDATGEAFDPTGPQVAFDAIRVEPAGSAGADGGVPGGGGGRDAVADDEGCTTAPGRAPGGGWVLLLALLGLVRRRRSEPAV